MVLLGDGGIAGEETARTTGDKTLPSVVMLGVVSIETPRRLEADATSLSFAESLLATAAAVVVAGGVIVAVTSTLAGAMVSRTAVVGTPA